VHRSELIKLQTPPFYAWPFTAGVVYTMGGLAINTSAQVLDQQRIPIPGLYASPPCAGGVFRDYYAGSIGSAGVFGWIAGQHAAAKR
jgi:succinate dehydrogenase/fumarate reductase flavoprotein subunit